MSLKVVVGFVLISFLLTTAQVYSNEAVEYLEASSVAAAPKVAPAPTTSPSAVPAPAPAPKIKYVDIAECPKVCLGRCAAHSRPNHCNRVCGTCCRRCKCVPPGTYGNREMCGKCYTDMTTHGGRLKCP